jgi:DNA mismatch repair ATPase MutS
MPHSLVLIDELGRGLTTFDGCAIAYAVAKFLTSRGCWTIFSTHYHELTSEFVARHDMKIYHMGVLEEEDNLVFIYRVSHNIWDYKNALGRPLNDNIESWGVSQFEAKDHTFQTRGVRF